MGQGALAKPVVQWRLSLTLAHPQYLVDRPLFREPIRVEGSLGIVGIDRKQSWGRAAIVTKRPRCEPCPSSSSCTTTTTTFLTRRTTSSQGAIAARGDQRDQPRLWSGCRHRHSAPKDQEAKKKIRSPRPPEAGVAMCDKSRSIRFPWHHFEI